MLTICQALDITIRICYTYYMFETIIIGMLSTIPAGLIVSSIVLGILWAVALYFLVKYVILPFAKTVIRGFLGIHPLYQLIVIAIILA